MKIRGVRVTGRLRRVHVRKEGAREQIRMTARTRAAAVNSAASGVHIHAGARRQGGIAIYLYRSRGRRGHQCVSNEHFSVPWENVDSGLEARSRKDVGCPSGKMRMDDVSENESFEGGATTPLSGFSSRLLSFYSIFLGFIGSTGCAIILFVVTVVLALSGGPFGNVGLGPSAAATAPTETAAAISIRAPEASREQVPGGSSASAAAAATARNRVRPRPGLTQAAPSGASAESAPSGKVQLFQLLKAELSNSAEAIFDATEQHDVGNVHATLVAEDAETSGRKTAEQQNAEALIEEVFETVEKYYYDARLKGWSSANWRDITDDALKSKPTTMRAAHRCVRRMLARGLSDPYTRFLTPREFTSFIKYDVTGIGLNLVSGEEYARKNNNDKELGGSADAALAEGRGGLFVLGLMKDSAAEVAGISRGDEIVSVDGVACVDGVTPFDVASIIQGDNAQRGSSVDIVVRQRETGELKELKVTRPEKVQTRSPVTWSVEVQGKEKIGYIRVQEMNSLAQRDVKAAVEAFESERASRIVLDLRDNPGGLVSVGVAISELFLPDNSVVVSSQGRHPSSQNVISTTKSPQSSTPLVVLVNGRTASSSEILAAALQDNCRATLVGDRTYGKGLIQSVFENFDGSALVITVGKYVTPAGKDIDKLGIVPDFNYMPSPEKASAKINSCPERL